MHGCGGGDLFTYNWYFGAQVCLRETIHGAATARRINKFLAKVLVCRLRGEKSVEMSGGSQHGQADSVHLPLMHDAASRAVVDVHPSPRAGPPQRRDPGLHVSRGSPLE